MAKMMTKSVFTVGLLVMLMSVPAFGGSINKSVKIAAGGESNGESSVNGSITIGENSVVSGDLDTVNGSIRVEAGAKIESAGTVNGGVRIAGNVEAESLSTVNGSISVGESTVIVGDVETVNGKISLGKGAAVSDDVSNINGKIRLTSAEVGGDISTVNGDIDLADGSVVKGNIKVEKPSNWGFGKNKNRKLRIVVGPGSSVAGVIDLERKIELFISDTAKVGGVKGVMTMADAVRFSGDTP
jgi:DUF4097 and DUF4098 domain-containing protein YvlB